LAATTGKQTGAPGTGKAGLETVGKGTGKSDAPAGIWGWQGSGSGSAGYRIIGSEAQYNASRQGYHVYEFLDAEGQVLYTGKAGSITSKARIDPVEAGQAESRFNNWVNRLRSEHAYTPWIHEARKVRVTYGLSEPEMYAFEDVRIEQTKRTNWNEKPGEFSTKYGALGLNREVLATSAGRLPKAEFSFRLLPGASQ
jgi:hypothetical protein